MRVTVRLFARLREVAGAEVLTVDVADPATLADVWRALTTEHPALSPFTGAVSGAINERFARTTSAVTAGDDIAFLPPVSGGGPRMRSPQ